LAPSSLIFRVEELARRPREVRARRVRLIGGTSAFPLTGFGISDMLIGHDATASDARTVRWKDVHMTAATGTIAPGSHMTILWENYELTPRDGTAEYEATLDRCKRDRSIAGRIVAQLVGRSLRSRAPRRRVGPSVVHVLAISAVCSAFADQMTLALGDTPEGSYTVTLVLN